MGTHMKRRSKRKSRKSRKRRGGEPVSAEARKCVMKCYNDSKKVVKAAVKANKALKKPGSIKAKMAAYQKAIQPVAPLALGASKGAKQARKEIDDAKKDKMDGTVRGIMMGGKRKRRRTKRRRKSRKSKKSRRKARKTKRRRKSKKRRSRRRR